MKKWEDIILADALLEAMSIVTIAIQNSPHPLRRKGEIKRRNKMKELRIFIARLLAELSWKIEPRTIEERMNQLEFEYKTQQKSITP